MPRGGCASGKIHILSLRKDGRPAANITFGVSSDDGAEISLGKGFGLIVEQFRGDYNREPSAEDRAALARFIKRVNTKDIGINSGPFGETDESMKAWTQRSLTRIEVEMGVRVGEEPTTALKHFRELLLNPSTSKSKQLGSALAKPLLRGNDCTTFDESLLEVVASAKNGWQAVGRFMGLALECVTKMNLVARMSEIGSDEDAGKKGAETCPQRHVEHLFCRRRSSCRLQPSEAEEHFCYALLIKHVADRSRQSQ